MPATGFPAIVVQPQLSCNGVLLMWSVTTIAAASLREASPLLILSAFLDTNEVE